MKYYHIIYNSSEKAMDGRAGFGIRTATEGISDELLKAVKNIKFFTDDWDSYEDPPTPVQFKENPASIEYIAKNYAVTNITDENGRVYYVIARRAYVAFDYSFYINGRPTRPGNYVIDYYIFDSTPDSSAYEILYEKALAGSNHFIPKSIQSTEDNQEMREISVGVQPALPVSEKTFTAETKDSLGKDVVKLFFIYLKAKQEGKKLVVKASPEKALELTADLYRLLDAEAATGVRTYINLRTQGTNDSFDIFFIHEDYPHQVQTGNYEYVEFDTATMPETSEAKTFASDLENLVASSFAANKADIDDTLKWLLMPEYSIVKSLSKLTIDSFFCYCIQPGNFMYENLKDNKGNLNDEFLKVLCTYTKKNEKNAERFNLVFSEAMNSASPKDVLTLIGEFNHLQELGFDLGTVTENVKINVCEQLLSDVNLLKKGLDTISLDAIKKFFVKDIFESKKEYLDSDTLDSYVIHLYKLFLNEEELTKKANLLYVHFLKRDMESSVFLSLVDDVFAENNDDKIKFFNAILNQGLKPFKVVWNYLLVYLPKVSQTPKFLEIFSNRIDDTEYAPMFYYAVKENKETYSSIESVEGLTDILYKNRAVADFVNKNYADDHIYDQFYRTIYAHAEDDPKKAYIAIKDNVIDFLKVKDERFLNLASYLKLIIERDSLDLKQLDDSKSKALYGIVVDKNNVKLFDELLPNFKKLVKKGCLDNGSLVNSYAKFHRDSHCIDLLQALVSTKDQVDLMAAIIKEYCKKNFKEAFDILDEYDLKDSDFELFMTKYYEKDYKLYKKKNQIKNFFKKVKKVFLKIGKKNEKVSSKTSSKK